ncbi:hypothetical protein [Rhodobacter lacus]|uniref:Uncharacterized protein n=1 Tax=Rhodobacter lacus TaxID=1641972 RepID=A0ABW5A4T5_9RHOB
MLPLSKLHAAAGGVAMATICGLQATILAHELTGVPADIAAMRGNILWVVALVLLPAMALAGGSGSKLGRGWNGAFVAQKRARMKRVAALGLGLLVPLAALLAWRASTGHTGADFVALTQLERLAALVNLWLLGRNMRDGLAHARARKPAAA